MGEILPLALTMVIGPQIITAILLITAKEPVKASLGYIAGVAFATLTGTLILSFVAGLFGWQEPSGDPSGFAKFVQTALIFLLAFAAFRTYLKREEIELPNWMGKLQNASPATAFKAGLMLFYLMPTDIAVMLVVGINLASQSTDKIALLPFLGLTTLLISLPFLAYLVFHGKAVDAMPKVRRWMNDNSWVVSIAADFVFIFLLWG